MSRLTQTNYLIHRQYLRQEWMSRDGAIFANLPLQDQLDLHDYCALSVPITDEQALRHRAEMTKIFLSLPQKAGRSYEAFRAAMAGESNQTIERRRNTTTSSAIVGGKRHSIRVAGIANSQPDQYRLARALIAQVNDPKISAELDRLVKKQSTDSVVAPSPASPPPHS
jgi:hypothetical protein